MHAFNTGKNDKENVLKITYNGIKGLTKMSTYQSVSDTKEITIKIFSLERKLGTY